jgi:hypothetical protein
MARPISYLLKAVFLDCNTSSTAYKNLLAQKLHKKTTFAVQNISKWR